MERDDDTRHPKLLYLLGSNTAMHSFQTIATCISSLVRKNITLICELCSFFVEETTLEPAFFTFYLTIKSYLPVIFQYLKSF